MKRYLIFGFLTILIITLNFAFIIAMVKEDVDINYGVLFLLWLVVIVAAAGLAFLENKRKKRLATEELQEKKVPEDHLKPTAQEVSPNLIYKNKTLQKFRIPLSKDFNDKVKAGFFGGHIVTEEFANEIMQSVYTRDGQLLGFISKKDEQLCQNLEQLYKEPLVCWGTLVWHEEEENFTIKGHVPILYSEPELNRFKRLVELKLELQELETSEEEVPMELYLQKAENFSFLEQSELTPSSLDHSMDPEILTSYSRSLQEAKDWKKLRELEKYPILISRLKQPYKKEVQGAIKKAGKKIEGKTE